MFKKKFKTDFENTLLNLRLKLKCSCGVLLSTIIVNYNKSIIKPYKNAAIPAVLCCWLWYYDWFLAFSKLPGIITCTVAVITDPLMTEPALLNRPRPTGEHSYRYVN